MKPEELEKKKRRAAEAKAKAERLHQQVMAAQRKADTRRKVLAGAFLLKEAEAGNVVDWSTDIKKMRDLDGFLTKKADREVFGLAPLPEKKKDETTDRPTPPEREQWQGQGQGQGQGQLGHNPTTWDQ